MPRNPHRSSLAWNSLTGPIPDALGENLTRLVELRCAAAAARCKQGLQTHHAMLCRLNNNLLSGSIPASLVDVALHGGAEPVSDYERYIYESAGGGGRHYDHYSALANFTPVLLPGATVALRTLCVRAGSHADGS